jgi:hypothetical protein
MSGNTYVNGSLRVALANETCLTERLAVFPHEFTLWPVCRDLNTFFLGWSWENNSSRLSNFGCGPRKWIFSHRRVANIDRCGSNVGPPSTVQCYVPSAWHFPCRAIRTTIRTTQQSLPFVPLTTAHRNIIVPITSWVLCIRSVELC